MHSKSLSKPISMRLTDEQFDGLKNLARKISYEQKVDITSPDLIRQAIDELLKKEIEK